MTGDQGLFPEEIPRLELHKGDRVRIQTIWGSEICTVVKILRDEFPMVMLDTEAGDRVTINVARVQEVDGS